MTGRRLAALRVEWLKVRTTRMWWILLLVMVGYVGLTAAFIAFAFGAFPQAAGPGAPSLDDRSTLLTITRSACRSAMCSRSCLACSPSPPSTGTRR